MSEELIETDEEGLVRLFGRKDPAWNDLVEAGYTFVSGKKLTKRILFDSDELLPCICGSPTYTLECNVSILSQLSCTKCKRKIIGILGEHVRGWNMSMKWNDKFKELEIKS